MKILKELRKLEKIRCKYKVFTGNASVKMIETGSKHVLGIERRLGSETLVAYFNFSPYYPEIWLPEDETMKDLISGKKRTDISTVIPGYGCMMFYKKSKY